ncbi:MAG: PAS domain S-box-containing protein, partial [Cyclobacteriaceae bacterium]
MKNENKKSSEFATLRQKAEELLNNKIPKAAFGNSEAKVHKLIHELEVHQIELELQNEELMLAKESEKSTAEKYIALYDFSPSGYFTLSPEGNISELNLTGSVLLGKDRSYLKNKRFSLFISEDSKSTFNRFIQKVFESNSKESCEIAVLRQDESQRYIHISGIAVENGEQCLLTLVDMTKQKLTEQKLHKSEELLNEFKLHKSEEFSKRVIESSNDSIKVLDLQGNLIYMSNGGQTLLEIDDISIYLNKSWVDLWKGDDNKAAAEAVSKAASGYATLFNGYCKTEKGTPKWWEIIVSPIKDTDGDVINLLAISRDVTERKQAEEKLKTSMEREKEFADIVRKAPLAMAFGYPDGRLANCNSAFSALTGYTILELQSLNWNEVLTPSKWKSSEGKQLSQLSPSKKNVKYEKEYIHKDGHSVPIELTVSAKFDSAGNLLHYVGFAIDITDRKLAEKELKESEER